VSFSGGAARLVNCCYMRGPVFVWLGTIDAAVTQAEEGSTWMAAEIDTGLGTVTVISGDAENCLDTAPPAQDSAKIRIPLYILRATTDPVTSEASYSVSADLRTCLAAVLYV
jgi:alpha-beta hydrolase superfamily lysophospholipase